MEFQTVDLDVCDNCVYVIANGCESEDDALAADRQLIEWPPDSGWRLVSGDCGEDATYCHFSWQSCDGCGSPLGGTRHLAHAMREKVAQ